MNFPNRLGICAMRRRARRHSQCAALGVSMQGSVARHSPDRPPALDMKSVHGADRFFRHAMSANRSLAREETKRAQGAMQQRDCAGMVAALERTAPSGPTRSGIGRP